MVESHTMSLQPRQDPVKERAALVDRLLSLPLRETRHLWLDFWTAFSRLHPEPARQLFTEAADVVINLPALENWIRKCFDEEPSIRPIDAARKTLTKFGLDRKWEPHLHRVALKVRRGVKF